MMKSSGVSKSFVSNRSAAIAVACSLLASGIAVACNVPVFRFALERWRADSYQVVVFHRGELSDADRATLRAMDDKLNGSFVNAELRSVDVEQLESEPDDHPDRGTFKSVGEQKLPAMAVRYPSHLKIEKPVWNSPASIEAIGQLLDSPLRQELIKRLVAGQTAVWLLLESGSKEADDGAESLLKTELARLEKELKLPELSTSPDDVILADAPLQIAFSVLRVNRESESEQALIKMLVGSESDLAERSDPMVFPVFGRGRALWPLVGAGITARNIEDSARFLVGPCSCEVKELNPGFDLLLSVDWNQQLSAEGVSFDAVAAATTVEEVPDGPAELVTIPSGSADKTPPATAQTIPQNLQQTTPAKVVVVRTPLWFGFAGAFVGGILLLLILGIIVAATVGGARSKSQ